jgi:sigma-E factor negative regulatory protein RseB
MARTVAVLTLSLVSVVAAGAVCPDTDPAAVRWLDKMSRSASLADYQGVITLQRGEELQVMQLSHSVGGGAESAHLTQLTGQGARVERNGHPLECVHPGHQLLRMGAELKSGRCGVAAHYRFAVDEGERVAGRQAVRIRVEPRDLYRYGYVLELDRETGLLLKARIVGRGNNTLELFQFAKVTYSDFAPEGTEADVVHQTLHPKPGSAVMPSAVSGRDWFVSWLPGGFMPTEAEVGGRAGRSYTDGLAVFSVFLEELGREMHPGEGVVRQGSTISYTRGLQLADAPVLITVIGEVPVNTARMVTDSIGWTK